MINPLTTPEDYELFIYTIPEQFPSVRYSTLAFIRRGATLARIVGHLEFDHQITLIIRERIIFSRLPVSIERYSYEVTQGEERLYWYDPQPHPDEPTLQSTHPHHKHVHPDIKHNRIPAPGLSFEHPNIPHLIREIESLVEQIDRGNVANAKGDL